MIANKTRSKCSKGRATEREKTPPVSPNRMHQVPKQRLSRARVGNIGNNNVKVENVWAAKLIERVNKRPI